MKIKVIFKLSAIVFFINIGNLRGSETYKRNSFITFTTKAQ